MPIPSILICLDRCGGFFALIVLIYAILIWKISIIYRLMYESNFFYNIELNDDLGVHSNIYMDMFADVFLVIFNV